MFLQTKNIRIKKLSPYSRRRITTTQTQNKTRQNYYAKSVCTTICTTYPFHIFTYTQKVADLCTNLTPFSVNCSIYLEYSVTEYLLLLIFVAKPKQNAKYLLSLILLSNLIHYSHDQDWPKLVLYHQHVFLLSYNSTLHQ